MEENEKKTRSPQFPFINLEKCVARARELEAAYGQSAGRSANIVKVWGYAEKSSGGSQTMAALSAFGLLDDEGNGDGRKLKLSSLALTILKDKRPGKAVEALKIAALRPKAINELWKEWGISRPPTHECISSLHLDKKYKEDAAERVLKIYDDTISYANLVQTNEEEDNIEFLKEADDDAKVEKLTKNVPIMSNERVVFSHELKPNQGYRILVTGEVDLDMVKSLEAFAAFQKTLVNTSSKSSHDEEGNISN